MTPEQALIILNNNSRGRKYTLHEASEKLQFYRNLSKMAVSHIKKNPPKAVLRVL